LTDGKIRLLVTDVDGTLVGNDKTLAPSTLAAVRRLRNANIRLAIVSSRAPVGLDILIEPLGLDTPRAGFNGGVVLGTDDRVLEELVIPHALCRDIVRKLEAASLDIWLFADNRWLLRNEHLPYIEHERRSLGIDYERVDDFTPFLDRTHKLMACSADIDAVATAEAELARDHGDQAAIHRSQPFHVDITNGRANKGEAALFIAHFLGIDAAEMACIGDMNNDIPMLDAAGLAIAMGNAPPDVRSHAHAVVATNEADGWAEAVDRLILPRAPR
jgi:Cof subfamily protein (haloacid dehalogenase superfamily)